MKTRERERKERKARRFRLALELMATARHSEFGDDVQLGLLEVCDAIRAAVAEIEGAMSDEAGDRQHRRLLALVNTLDAELEAQTALAKEMI